MPRPFWSGQIQLSLVSFGVSLFPAVEAKGEIRFHQISRSTGKRIHHQKVTGEAGSDTPVEKNDIVKGYEYRRGEYVTIEPEEIENLRLPSRHNIAITQCVELDELSPALFEKPYFVVPDGEGQAEAFAVIRKALQSTGKAALGKIAFGGREHLIAITAPPESDGADGGSSNGGSNNGGMMAYTLRYAEELRRPATYFSEIKKVAIDEEQLSLAKELIQRKTTAFSLDKFHDEYEAALKEMVEAKVNHLPIPKDEAAPRAGTVIHLMDVLRKSVDSMQPEQERAPSRARARKAPAKVVEAKQGPRLVRPAAKAKAVRARKSA
jgi:DNA end-binding protein Ku